MITADFFFPQVHECFISTNHLSFSADQFVFREVVLLRGEEDQATVFRYHPNNSRLSRDKELQTADFWRSATGLKYFPSRAENSRPQSDVGWDLRQYFWGLEPAQTTIYVKGFQLRVKIAALLPDFDVVDFDDLSPEKLQVRAEEAVWHECTHHNRPRGFRAHHHCAITKVFALRRLVRDYYRI